MTNETQPIDAQMRAKALSRWEGEGGALYPTGGADAIDEAELRILARIGAALLDHWSELSPDLQGRVVQRARTIGGPADHTRVKENLARVLHEHRREC